MTRRNTLLLGLILGMGSSLIITLIAELIVNRVLGITAWRGVGYGVSIFNLSLLSLPWGALGGGMLQRYYLQRALRDVRLPWWAILTCWAGDPTIMMLLVARSMVDRMHFDLRLDIPLFLLGWLGWFVAGWIGSRRAE